VFVIIKRHVKYQRNKGRSSVHFRASAIAQSTINPAALFPPLFRS